MKIHTLILMVGGVLSAATGAQAQTAAPVDALTSLQNEAGAIVGEAFRRPDPIVVAVSTPGSPAVVLGKGLRTSMEIPGAVFAGALKPFADADNSAPPAPVAAPAPRHPRHARVRRHRTLRQS